ncbi:helix-turn-helix domain-containing protein [Streptomyces sp. NPDC051569]|uniref:helix-turn-helix domain-containing protein n=1 Tax=Streptomyces sp. NPDC051569 TaxID=3365661 RepID=UPI0037A90108
MTQNATRNTPQDATAGASAAPLPAPKERRRLREAKAMTERQAAVTVGVTRSTIRSWETGRTAPRGRKGAAYAKLLAGLAAELLESEKKAAAEVLKAAAERSAARQRHNATGAQDRTGSPEPPPPATVTRTAEHPAAEPPGTEAGTATRTAERETRTADAGAASSTEFREIRESGESSEFGGSPDPAEAPTASTTPEDGPPASTPEQAFDALYAHAAPALVRQAYLLTGRRARSRESVERAFHLAWERWPEVAVDRDPAGWVRAAAYEYAMSPWHRLRRAPLRPDPVTGEPDGPGGAELRAALLDLPPSYRRTLLLYDGLGLDLPETAAETEASTPATANRLTYARGKVAERLPELTDPALLHERLGSLTHPVTKPSIAPARVVRTGCERRARFWTRTAIAFTALIVGATGFTVVTAPTRYEPPQAPGKQIGSVPVPSGPERLSAADQRLRDRLRAEPMNGPPRLVPLSY